MKAIRVPPLTDAQRDELDQLCRTTQVPRLRTRAQMVLLSAERELKVPDIAAIVRESDDTVRRWLKRYLAEGVEGLKDAPRPGRPSEITEAYRSTLLAAVLIDPLDVDAIVMGMARMVLEPDLRAMLSAAGRQRSRTFTIERSMQQTLQIIEAAVQGNRAHSVS